MASISMKYKERTIRIENINSHKIGIQNNKTVDHRNIISIRKRSGSNYNKPSQLSRIKKLKSLSSPTNSEGHKQIVNSSNINSQMIYEVNNLNSSKVQAGQILEHDEKLSNDRYLEQIKKIKVSLKPMNFKPKLPSTPADKSNPIQMQKFNHVKIRKNRPFHNRVLSNASHLSQGSVYQSPSSKIKERLNSCTLASLSRAEVLEMIELENSIKKMNPNEINDSLNTTQVPQDPIKVYNNKVREFNRK